MCGDFVCVYTICKNEEKNIDRWIESVIDGADLICILDTGSIDGTIDKIKMYKEKYRDKIVFGKIELYPFSFCDAKNYALDLAKNAIASLYKDDEYDCIDDSNKFILPHNFYKWYYNYIFVNLDLDEFIEKDGINKIRELWNHNSDIIQLQSISMKKNNDGSYTATTLPVNQKVHNCHFHWERNVHEILAKYDGSTEKDWEILISDIEYKHEQDISKPRYYYNMLLDDFKNGDRTSRTLVYLCQESYNRELYDDLCKYSNLALECLYNDKNDEFYMDYQYIIYTERFLAISYNNKKMYDNAKNCYLKCIDIFNSGKFPRLRIIYKELAETFWYIDKNKSVIYYSQINHIKRPENCWCEDYSLYNKNQIAKIYSDLSNACYYCDDIINEDNLNQSIFYAEKAIEYDSSNEQYIYNLDIIKNSRI